MAGLPKSIIKKHGVTKKAWAIFRSMKSGGKKSKKKVQSTKNPGVTVAKKRRGRAKDAVKSAARRIKAAGETRPGKIVVSTVEVAGGAIAMGTLINKAPVVGSWQRPAKIGVLAALGLSTLFFVKNRHVKYLLGGGSLAAAVLAAGKEYLKVDVLAGSGGRPLTPSEMRLVSAGQMNMPMAARMNAPLATAPANAGFGGGFGS